MNLCSRSSPYSLNCHVGAMLVICMLCRITAFRTEHRTESVSVMDHEQTIAGLLLLLLLLLLCYMVAAVIGDWTMAVSRKERKNRSKRDDASKHERPMTLADIPPHKTETPNSSLSPGSNKAKKKVVAV